MANVTYQVPQRARAFSDGQRRAATHRISIGDKLVTVSVYDHNTERSRRARGRYAYAQAEGFR